MSWSLCTCRWGRNIFFANEQMWRLVICLHSATLSSSAQTSKAIINIRIFFSLLCYDLLVPCCIFLCFSVLLHFCDKHWFWVSYTSLQKPIKFAFYRNESNICDVYLKILVFKPCSHWASVLKLSDWSITHLNFEASVDALYKLCNWNQYIPFKRQH